MPRKSYLRARYLRKPSHLTEASWIEDRFWSKIRFDQESGCWLWIGAKTRSGSLTYGWSRKQYGSFSVDGRKLRVHRYAYSRFSGKKLDPKKDLHHHKCKIKLCCNWTHMEQVTKRKHGKISASY